MFIKEHQRLLASYKKNSTKTKEEYVVEDILKELGIRYMSQKGFLAQAYKCFIVDFYIPKSKLIIEVDGTAHTGRSYQDESRDKYFLYQRGMRTLRIKNEELSRIDLIKQKIMAYT